MNNFQDIRSIPPTQLVTTRDFPMLAGIMLMLQPRAIYTLRNSYSMTQLVLLLLFCPTNISIPFYQYRLIKSCILKTFRIRKLSTVYK